jgi:hypothetical protein
VCDSSRDQFLLLSADLFGRLGSLLNPDHLDSLTPRELQGDAYENEYAADSSDHPGERSACRHPREQEETTDQQEACTEDRHGRRTYHGLPTDLSVDMVILLQPTIMPTALRMPPTSTKIGPVLALGMLVLASTR